MTDEPNGPQGAPGAVQGASNVTPLRLPGAAPPEAFSAAWERLAEAMLLSSTISRAAADSYIMAIKVASASAPYGQHSTAVVKIIAALQRRLEAHLATLPDTRPPGGVA